MTYPPRHSNPDPADDDWTALPPVTPYDQPDMFDQGRFYPAPYPSAPYPSAPYPSAPPPSGPEPRVSEPRTDGRAVTSLVLGLVSLPLIFLCAGLALPLPVVAVILGIVSVRDIRASSGRRGEGVAIAGIVTGAIGTAAMVAFLVLIGIVVVGV
ncbi:DUF4190 domain-containing protein [Gordonia sp. CPCC 206044]|uniref:DUF4190 domain-containing protein n=1 Tax=Gordonia sp. CPCC 206044 TaxID=3140793 RepID=UPI003AF3BF71